MSDKYKIIAEDSKAALEIYINEYIKNGWVPTGGVTKKGNLLYQAIVKSDLVCVDPDCLERKLELS